MEHPKSLPVLIEKMLEDLPQKDMIDRDAVREMLQEVLDHSQEK